VEFGGKEYDRDVYVVGGELEGAAYFVDGGGVEGVENLDKMEATGIPTVVDLPGVGKKSTGPPYYAA